MDAAGGGHLFAVEPFQWDAAKGHGVVTSMAAGNDVTLLGTSRGWVIRNDFGVGDSVGSSNPLPFPPWTPSLDASHPLSLHLI